MDITPQDNTTQPISDDQELAKALAGVLPDESTDLAAPADDQTDASAAPVLPPAFSGFPEVASTPEVTEAPAPVEAPALPTIETTHASSVSSPELDSIKSQALTELRPLMDHVDLPAEERFDAYLMLLRSTDDPSLVAPAHTAAQEISDEKRKAEALLEIIKEIDYLSRGSQPNA